MGLVHSPSIVQNGLVFYLDAANVKSYSGSGTVWNDISGSGNNGALVGSVAISGGTATITEGSNNIVSTNLPMTYLPALSNFTMECWVKLTAYPQPLAVANQYGNTHKAGMVFGATYYSGAGLAWFGNTSGTSFETYAWIRGADASRNTLTINLSLNQWYQLVMVHNYSAPQLSFYVNGAVYSQVTGASQEYTPSLVAQAGNIGIAKPQTTGGGTLNYVCFGGMVASAKIYTRDLSSAEILQNFRAVRGRFGV